MYKLAGVTLLVLLCVNIAGCGGTQNTALPLRVVTPRVANSTARLTLSIPHVASASSQRRPRYVSPATQALAVTISGGPTPLSEGINLTASNPNCQSSIYSNLVCTVNLPLTSCPSSSACYTGTFTTYDAAYTNAIGGSCSPLSSCTQPAGASALSQAQGLGFSVVVGALNTIPITLGGVPASVRIVADSADILGNVRSGLTLASGQNGQVSVLGVDADGNYILGPGAPTVNLTISEATHFTVSTPIASAPNVFTITNVSSLPAGAQLTAAVTPTLNSGASPLAATISIFSQSPTLYVTNSNGAVTSYTSDGAQQSLFAANLNGPFGIAYDSANGWLYVVNLYTPAVTAYNLQGVQETLAGGFPNLASPFGIAYDPANDRLYVVNAGSNSVTAYDSQGNPQTLTGNFPNLNGPVSIVYDPANGWLYVVNQIAGNSSVTAYNSQGVQQTLVGNFPNLNYPYGIAYDPANGWLYVVSRFLGTPNGVVTAYNSQGTQQVLTGSFPSLSGPYSIAFNPANGWIYVTNQYLNSNITAYDSQGVQQGLAGSFPGLVNPYDIAIVP